MHRPGWELRKWAASSAGFGLVRQQTLLNCLPWEDREKMKTRSSDRKDVGQWSPGG